MLEAMEKKASRMPLSKAGPGKVKTDGDEKHKIYDKRLAARVGFGACPVRYMCYCQKTSASLSAQMAEARRNPLHRRIAGGTCVTAAALSEPRGGSAAGVAGGGDRAAQEGASVWDAHGWHYPSSLVGQDRDDAKTALSSAEEIRKKEPSLASGGRSCTESEPFGNGQAEHGMKPGTNMENGRVTGEGG